MLELRLSNERGHAEHGWLDSRHTFSFADYHDPKHMGFRSLRVINEDRVEAGRGFPTHPHRDMEILSYVLEGSLEHKDSMGNGSVIRPGDVQRMSAGTGVRHSEQNASKTEGVHFLQIWILPEKAALPPGYEQKHFSDQEKRGRFRLVGSRDGREGSVVIHQDVALHAGLFGAGERSEYGLSPGRHAFLHVARGRVRVNGRELGPGDALAASQESALTLEGVEDSEVLLFDLA